MTPSERIKEILKLYKLNAKTFSEHIGMARPQAIYDILNGKTKSISYNLSCKIISVFSDINKTWLITGEGDMLKPNSTVIQNTSGVVITGNNTNGHIDNRQYYSDSPDVLRAQIELLDERIKEKDAQIKEKDAQIKEKDAQIKQLLDILQKK